MKAKLKKTKCYDLFEYHSCNRELHDNPVLEASMRKHGFLASSAIHVARSKTSPGKLTVIRGHHRLHYAMMLGLEVYYIEDEDVDIFELESHPQNWNLEDFLAARARAGDKDCLTALEFANKHGLSIGSAVSLVGGQSAGSGNKGRDVKRGAFKAGDMRHANEVVQVTDLCHDLQIEFARATAFVSAVSMMLRVPEFDVDTFCHRIRLHPVHMRKRGRVDEYLIEIEELYNYGARGKRAPLKHRAEEVSRERQRSQGRNVNPRREPEQLHLHS